MQPFVLKTSELEFRYIYNNIHCNIIYYIKQVFARLLLLLVHAIIIVDTNAGRHDKYVVILYRYERNYIVVKIKITIMKKIITSVFVFFFFLIS